MTAIPMGLTVALVAYTVTLLLLYLALTYLALKDLIDLSRARRSQRPEDIFSLPQTPPVSILVPAYNEQAGISASVRSLLNVNYPDFEIIVVNDGSSDDTMGQLVADFALEPIDRFGRDALDTAEVRGVYRSHVQPRLIVVDKENGGKADALNAGINTARFPLICVVDADSILKPDALLKAAVPFVYRPDVTVATGGVIRLTNGARIDGGSVVDQRMPASWLGRFQLVEYVRAFIVGRAGWSRVRSLLIVSGAFGVFRRDVLVEIGGYDTSTVGEDAEVVVRMHRHLRDQGRRYRIEFIADPVCMTEAPEDRGTLRRQRMRWHRGLLETLTRHRTMIFNPRYGRLGMVGLPYLLMFELLGPVIEILGLAALVWLFSSGAVDLPFAITLFLLVAATGVATTVASLAFDEIAFPRFNRLRQNAALVGVAVLENLGYRQMTVWWRVRGLWQAFRRRHSWGSMVRTGTLGGATIDAGLGKSAYGDLRAAVMEVAAAGSEAAATHTTRPFDFERDLDWGLEPQGP